MKYFISAWLMFSFFLCGCGTDNSATLPENISKRPKMTLGETGGAKTQKSKPGNPAGVVP